MRHCGIQFRRVAPSQPNDVLRTVLNLKSLNYWRRLATLGNIRFSKLAWLPGDVVMAAKVAVIADFRERLHQLFPAELVATLESTKQLPIKRFSIG